MIKKLVIIAALLAAPVFALAQTTTPPPNLVTPPTVNLAPQIAAGVAKSVNGEIVRRANVTMGIWNVVWNNKNATPDQIVAALGNQAALVFNLANENVAHISRSATLAGHTINDYLPAQYQTTPRTVTINSDGTVTLGPAPSS